MEYYFPPFLKINKYRKCLILVEVWSLEKATYFYCWNFHKLFFAYNPKLDFEIKIKIANDYYFFQFSDFESIDWHFQEGF